MLRPPPLVGITAVGLGLDEDGDDVAPGMSLRKSNHNPGPALGMASPLGSSLSANIFGGRGSSEDFGALTPQSPGLRLSTNTLGSSKGSGKGIGPPGTSSYAKTMMNAASRINGQVSSLYRSTKRQSTDSVDTPKSLLVPETPLPGDRSPGLAALVEEGEDGRSSSEGSQASRRPHAKQEGHDKSGSESGSDEYDFNAAADRVNFLLETLKTEKRTEIMEQLAGWYSLRVETVDMDKESIQNLEDEHKQREEDMKDNMKNLLQSFEDKQMREVRVLVQCNQTISRGVTRRPKKRRKFSSKPSEEDGGGGQLGDSIRSNASKSSTGTPAASSKKKLKKAKTLGRTGKKGKGGGGADGDKGGDEDKGEGTASGRGEGDGGTGDGEDASSEGFGSDEEDGSAKEEEDKFTKAMREAFDVEAARRLLKEMQETPQKVLNAKDEITPSQILTSLAMVQEGQRDLEKRAQIAKQNCDMLKSAVAYLTEGTEASQAVMELIEQVRQQVLGEEEAEKSMGPDPEELEEECQSLEKLLAQQEKEIEDYKKQRERNQKMSLVLQNMKDDKQKQQREAVSTAAGEEAEAKAPPAMQRSQMMDARLEGIVVPKPENVRPVVKAKARPQSGRKDGSPTKPGSAAAATFSLPQSGQGLDDDGGAYLGNGPDLTDPKVEALQLKIEEKEVMIKRAKRLLWRMKGEYHLIQYCARKAEAGIESIVEEFNPPVPKPEDEMPEDWDLHSDPEEDALGPENDPSSPAAQGSASPKAARQSVASTGGSRTSTVAIRRGSNAPKAPQGGGDASPPRRRNSLAPQLSKQWDKADKVSPLAVEKAEEEINRQITAMQDQVNRDAARIKAEKARQKELKKEITQLKKRFKAMTKADKSAPTTLDGLQKQVEYYENAEAKIRQEITVLQDELNSQNRMLEKAQAEALAKEEQRRATQGIHQQARSEQMAAGGQRLSVGGDLATPGAGGRRRSSAEVQGGLGAVLGAAGDLSHANTAPGIPVSAPEARPQGRLTNAAQEELAELLKLQSHNEELKNEIDEMVQKMQQLRKAMKKGRTMSLSGEALRKIVGIPEDAEEVKPPPEYFNLKKEVRAKQNEVRGLRKRWWVDHKDLETLLERMRQNAIQGGPPLTTGRRESDGEVYSTVEEEPQTTDAAANGGFGDGSGKAVPTWLQGMSGGGGGKDVRSTMFAIGNRRTSLTQEVPLAPARVAQSRATVAGSHFRTFQAPLMVAGASPNTRGSVAIPSSVPSSLLPPPRSRFSAVQMSLRKPGPLSSRRTMADLFTRADEDDEET